MSRPPGGWVPWAGLGLLEGDSGRGGGHPSRPGRLPSHLRELAREAGASPLPAALRHPCVAQAPGSALPTDLGAEAALAPFCQGPSGCCPRMRLKGGRRGAVAGGRCLMLDMS